MKSFLKGSLAGLALLTVVTAGCQSDPSRIGVTNPNQPGPAVGRAVGSVVGGVGGNVAGGVVGVGEGIATAGGLAFKNERHIIRRWHTEKTADGRTIQVPEDIVVDEYGRPLGN
jgi:hypothetical protein